MKHQIQCMEYFSYVYHKFNPNLGRYGCFRKEWYPKSSILMGFLFNHPFWSTPIFGPIYQTHWSKKNTIQHHDSSISLQEYTGPKGNCRVLATQWANGLDFSKLPGHLRHRAVRLAAEACLVQLLITGFIHADPHEGPDG